MQGTAVRRTQSKARTKQVRPKRKSAWSAVLKWFLLFVFFTVSILIYLRQEEEMDRLANVHEGLQQELTKAQDEFKSIQELSDMVGSDQYVERIARDQLGLVAPDEIIFIH